MKSKYNKCRHDCYCCKPVKSVPCVHTNTDCTFVTEDLDCIESKKGTMLTKVLSRIDEAICELRSKVAGATSYIFQNVGAGAEVFKKVSGGIVDYRTIISTDTSVKITEKEDEIDLETKPIQSDSDYIHVGRVGGVDRIDFSGVGEVISTDGTVTVNNQAGGYSDLSVNIPDSMTIEEANCDIGVPTVSVDTDSQVATALCLVSDTVTITREGDSIRLESEEQGATYTGSETIEIDSNNEITRKALTGDVEAPDNSNVTTIKDNAVTYAKIQKVSANKLLGRQSGIPTTGNVQEISIGNNLTLSQAGVLSADAKYEADIRKIDYSELLDYNQNGATLIITENGSITIDLDLNTLLNPFEVFIVNDTLTSKHIPLASVSGWTYKANAQVVSGQVTLDEGGTCVIMRRASDNVILILGDITI